ncbi:MAG: 3-deoxy-manno-octulosonate cytidylyltransferase [Prolixibacteraceae bacterium]|jgi:3-deoxy-manno-octulosonate cytidylyltransferase (CMP-KDO synthetase)|nr:3-deoxy-manno-octulosonate cytidylyltransferase [Prolixibacteraceae bacterium]
MKFIGIIPARYQSTRFPGKPLAILGNKPVIQWVYENVSKILSDVWVATDDERIFKAVESFGGRAVFTSSDHQSGTDRCAEAARKISEMMIFDVVVNIQGDEPFIRTGQIKNLCSCFDSRETEIATLIKPVTELAELHNPNRPKVVVNTKMEALLFSRSTIPYIRGSKPEEWPGKAQFFSHIGMYAYRADILQKLTRLPVGKLEQAESLEQLRWLENGYRIKTAITEIETIGIDTPEDLEAAKTMIR